MAGNKLLEFRKDWRPNEEMALSKRTATTGRVIEGEMRRKFYRREWDVM